MPKTSVVSLNLGSSYTGREILAQLINSIGNNLTPLISEGFFEVGEGYYLWRYDKFPDNFIGGIKFYDKNDSSKILTFIDFSSMEFIDCGDNSICSYPGGNSFTIDYQGEANQNYYAILFNYKNYTQAWKKNINNFSLYNTLYNTDFVLELIENKLKPGMYSYSILDVTNIPAAESGEYYFVEFWKKKTDSFDRLIDENVGYAKICWGLKKDTSIEDLPKNIWEYNNRTINNIPEKLTPETIWTYSSRSLTDTNFDELKKVIINAIESSTGKTIEEILKSNKELLESINKTFILLDQCCSRTAENLQNIQVPRIGIKGSKNQESNIKFK